MKVIVTKPCFIFGKLQKVNAPLDVSKKEFSPQCMEEVKKQKKEVSKKA